MELPLPNLLFLNSSNLQKFDKFQMSASFLFRFLVSSFTDENCHNHRTSVCIDMKLEPISKLEKKNNNFKTAFRRWEGGRVWGSSNSPLSVQNKPLKVFPNYAKIYLNRNLISISYTFNTLFFNCIIN